MNTKNTKKSMTILYKVHNNLYVNLTNRCSSACTFCLRQTMDKVGESDSLWLEHEPTFEEVKAAFAEFSMADFEEVVFCGFGEPTERLDTLLAVADYVKKEFHMATRLNTNGQGDLIQKKSIAPLLKGRIDTVSISLNTPNRDEYHRLVKSQFGDEAFDAMLHFAKDCTNYVPHVVMSTVSTTISTEEEAQCQKLCDELGVTYRIRPWED